MSATTITLTEYVQTLTAAACFYSAGRKQDSRLLHEQLLPALAKAAQADNALVVAVIAERIGAVVKHPDGGYQNIAEMTGGVRLG